jgi:hypothetical protein
MQEYIDFFTIQMELGMLPFSIPMFLCTLYWMLMIVGVLDMEILDSLFGMGDAGAEGVGEAAGEAVGEAAAESAMEGMLEGAQAAGEGSNVMVAALSFLNFGQAPATIVATFFSFFMWTFANVGYCLFHDSSAAVPFGLLGFFVALFAASFVMSSILTHFTTKPFRKLMVVQTYHGELHLIGKVCEVTSRSVTKKNGRVEVTLEGSPLVLHAVCEKENELSRGSKAVIVDYEKGRDQYVIEPMF